MALSRLVSKLAGFSQVVPLLVVVFIKGEETSVHISLELGRNKCPLFASLKATFELCVVQLACCELLSI